MGLRAERFFQRRHTLAVPTAHLRFSIGPAVCGSQQRLRLRQLRRRDLPGQQRLQLRPHDRVVEAVEQRQALLLAQDVVARRQRVGL